MTQIGKGRSMPHYFYLHAYNKMAALGYAYTLRKQTAHSPERCMSQNATSAEFLEVQTVCPCVCLGPVGVLCQALEARKYSVGRIIR